MTKIQDLYKLGQSIWIDYIRRSFISSGELQWWLDQGVGGITSNPSIFEQAIAGSADYDDELARLTAEGKSTEEIYEALALEDIGNAADLLRPVFEGSKGEDGYVSLEVSPTLANDTEETIAEAKRLFAALNRPNVMIKIPATPAGIPAVTEVIGAGVNVNVTLIFSLDQYMSVVEAYIAGLEKLRRSGGNLVRVASVASIFISRIDLAVDAALEKTDGSDLLGNAAIDNAKVAYGHFRDMFSEERWLELKKAGAKVQRPLWASTGTKNPAYSDTLYVDGLIGPDTVNTLPPAAALAFLDHGSVRTTVDEDLAGSHARLAELERLGIDLDGITRKLMDKGVSAFAKSFKGLLASIEEKRERLQAGRERMSIGIGNYQSLLENALAEMKQADVMRRIFAYDFTVWKEKPEEIINRLGWLNIADSMLESLDRIEELVGSVRGDGYTNVLLLGMGGSSLAPEVFSKTFGEPRPAREGALPLEVLDSTDPGAVLAAAESHDPAKTLFIVSTKSGGTVETLSFFKFFCTRTIEAVGAEQAGRHFVAITDPGSKLQELAEKFSFRSLFLNDPNIGGRYSALSYFGLVPAALVGADLRKLLARALVAAQNSESCNCPVDGDNAAARLGAIMGELAKAGRDKITLITSPPITSFGDWVEQLIAESTGKEGRGIIPVVSEQVGLPGVYGDDRFFVYLRLEGDATHDSAVRALEEAGFPVVRFYLDDVYDLGGQFFLWEMATAVAGYRLGINPFDQPDVEAAKVLAREMVAAYRKDGRLPELKPSLKVNNTAVYGDVEAENPGEVLMRFVSRAEEGAYIALQAYLHPTRETDRALAELGTKLRDTFKLAVTIGYGPRFLHSTGQLHKGDAGKGLFIQFTSRSPRDVGIPDEAGSAESAMTFGVLEAAQGLGDRQALLDSGRKVIRFEFETDVEAGLEKLAAAL